MAPVRIVLTGPECTGKTTLAQALARWLGAPCLVEASREVAEELGRPLGPGDVETIARRHLEREAALLKDHAVPLLVLDTDLVSTVVYARHYYGACPDWIVEAARVHRGSLYLLGTPDLPWSADGVRDRPHARHTLHAGFTAVLRTLEATVLPIDGNGPARFRHAVAAIRGWRAARPDQGGGAAVPSSAVGTRVTR